jgi:hypothetical protein
LCALGGWAEGSCSLTIAPLVAYTWQLGQHLLVLGMNCPHDLHALLPYCAVSRADAYSFCPVRFCSFHSLCVSILFWWLGRPEVQPSRTTKGDCSAKSPSNCAAVQISHSGIHDCKLVVHCVIKSSKLQQAYNEQCMCEGAACTSMIAPHSSFPFDCACSPACRPS